MLSRSKKSLAALALTPMLLLTSCGDTDTKNDTQKSALTPAEEVAAAFDALDDGTTLASAISVQLPNKMWTDMAKDHPDVPPAVWAFAKAANLEVTTATATGSLEEAWDKPGAVDAVVAVNNGDTAVAELGSVAKTVFVKVSLAELSSIAGTDLASALNAGADGWPASATQAVDALIEGRAITVKQETLTRLARELGEAVGGESAGLLSGRTEFARDLYAALGPALVGASDVTEVKTDRSYRLEVDIADLAVRLADAVRPLLPAEDRSSVPSDAEIRKQVPAGTKVTADLEVRDGVLREVTFDLGQLASLVDRAKLTVAGGEGAAAGRVRHRRRTAGHPPGRRGRRR